jgi:hypothetical protein
MEDLLKLFIFIGMWIGISYGLALAAGWGVLAKHYLNKSDFQGELFRFRSGQMGKANYGGCLVLGTNPRGFYLTLFWLSRFAHPALLIPWEDITVTITKQRLFSRAHFEFAKTPEIKLSTSTRLAETIASSSGGRLIISDYS